MQSQGFELLTASAKGSEIKHLRQGGVAHQVIPLTRTITPFRDLWCLYLLIRLIKSFKPHLVHTHTPKAGVLGMLAAWICRVPIRMHTVAGIPYQETTGLKKRVLRWVEKITYHTATQVCPNSRGLQQFMESEFPKLKSKYRVIGNGSSNGVNTEFFKPTRELDEAASALKEKSGIGHGDRVVCFVGRLVRDKGLVELVEACRSLQHRERKTWLVLVGPFEQQLDPLPPHTLQTIQTHETIITPGFQEDIRPWIRMSQALVLPSYREGFPNVLLQAGSLEIPCIATDINGCNEIIADGKTGLLIKPKNVESLKKALQHLLEHPDKAAEMGRLARQRIENHYSQSYIWNELLLEYKRQLSLVQVHD